MPSAETVDNITTMKMLYYTLGVQCVGSFDTVEDESTGAIAGKELVLEHWPEDDILCGISGGNFVTQSLADALQISGLTGFVIKSVKVVDGDQFFVTRKSRRGQRLPQLFEFQITGDAGKDDFGRDKHLVVSEKAMQLLKKFSLKYRIVNQYRGAG